MNSQFRTRALSKYGNCQIIKPAFMGLKLVRNNFKIPVISGRPENFRGSKWTGRSTDTKIVRIELIEPVELVGIGSFQRIEVKWKNTSIHVLKYFQIRPKLITGYLSIMFSKLLWPTSKMIILGSKMFKIFLRPFSSSILLWNVPWYFRANPVFGNKLTRVLS